MTAPVINLACPYGSTIKDVVSVAWGDMQLCLLTYSEAMAVLNVLQAACAGRQYCSVALTSVNNISFVPSQAYCMYAYLYNNATWTCGAHGS